jgi:hypothetical protein
MGCSHCSEGPVDGEINMCVRHWVHMHRFSWCDVNQMNTDDGVVISRYEVRGHDINGVDGARRGTCECEYMVSGIGCCVTGIGVGGRNGGGINGDGVCRHSVRRRGANGVGGGDGGGVSGCGCGACVRCADGVDCGIAWDLVDGGGGGFG